MTAQFPPARPTCAKCRPAVDTKPPSSSSSSAFASASHTTKRHYIGPIPVQPSHAKAIALAIADDTLLQTAPAPDDDSSSWDHVDWDNEKPSEDTSPTVWTDPFKPASPDSPVHKPRPRPRPVHREPSAASVLSKTSFVSAQPFFDTEAESSQDAPSSSTGVATQRFGGLQQRNKSFPAAPPSILTNKASLTVPPRSIANVRSAENLRSNVSRAAVPLLDLPLAEVDEPAPNSAQPANGHAHPDRSPLRKVKSADSTLAPRFEPRHAALQRASHTPVLSASADAPLRRKTSFVDMSPPSSSPERARSSHLHPTWMSPVQSIDRSISPHNMEGRDEEQADERARSKLFQPGVGRGLPTSRSFARLGSTARAGSHAGIHLPVSIEHARDVSRQSRMSRVSTAGTFNTIGTVVSEGSFAATSGAAQRLSRRIFTNSTRRRNSRRTSNSPQTKRLRSKLTLVRSNSVARGYEMPTPSTTHTRHASSPFAVRRLKATSTGGTPRQVSMTTEAAAEASEYTSGKPREFKGVLPGAVGTSGGGTKWVGQSFEVGKRFYDVIDARRAELQKVQPCTCSEAPAKEPPTLDVDAADKARQDERAAEVEHMKQSPDGVITLLAQEAQVATDDKASIAAVANRQLANLDAQVAKADAQTAGKTAKKYSSIPSIISPPQLAPIEARQGWDDIVSKTSKLTPGRPATLTPTVASTVYQSAVSSAPGSVRDESNHRSVPNLKILARTSSLQESDASSVDALPPMPNGIAQRASSLARSSSATPALFDALSHPSPPSVVEENDPQLVHALLRRTSDVGVRPDVTSDVASDHAIATKPVSSAPFDPNNLVLEEQEPVPLDKTPADELAPPHQSVWGANLLKTSFAGHGAQRKKKVKFDNGPSGRLTASLFAGKADDVIQSMQPGPSRGFPGDTKPRPPEEVLARPQPHALQKDPEFHSPGSELGASEATLITRKTVLKKDRMLVKLAWTPHEDLPKDFDELQARKYTIRDENWREFIVVFRMGKLELWGDATFTSKVVGHGDRLKLRHTIPLSRGSTFVSLFSPIDRIFAITYQPWRSASKGIHLRRHGTEIVLFDCRARSAAVDWMWELWRELGGLIPESLELHVPSFGLKIKIPIPDEMPAYQPEAQSADGSKAKDSSGVLALTSIGQSQDGGEGFKVINRSNIIAMTWKLFQGVPELHDLIEQSREKGLRLELAWRRGTELDWVYNERTVDNEPRHWAVLCGSLLRDHRFPSMLELRVAAHYPTSVLSAPGHYLQEPPAVEGYLWRLKPVSGALTRLYLTTYDSHLYICRASRAFQPDRHLAFQLKEVIDMRVPRTSGSRPPKPADDLPAAKKSPLARALAKFVGHEKAVRRDEDMSILRQNVLEAISYPAETDEEMQAQIDAYQSFERRRQFEQIRNSDGFIDLKLIYMIKTIGAGPVRCPGLDDVRKPCKQQGSLRKLHGDALAAQQEDEESDVEDDSDLANDIGGVEGLNRAEDSDDLQKSRQVELTLTNGKSFRLEAFSASVAREWVEKIAELVRYWRRRERADATELMYASGVDLSELNKHLQGRGSKQTTRIEVADEDRLSPILGNIWNWCAIEGCRNVVRSGRLFHKKTKYGAFKARDYVLIAGRLLCFKLVRSVRTSRARQNNGIFHRRQDTVIHLRDAYVYSGKLSEDMLQSGRSDPAQAVSGIGGGGSNSGERHRVPRVFADGLFSTDEDEDCTFVIRYRPERVNTPADPTVPTVPAPMPTSQSAHKGKAKSSSSLPALEDKTHTYIAMRARSKMERDLWVRCIAYEIERIVRDDLARETQLKNTGSVDFK